MTWSETVTSRATHLLLWQFFFGLFRVGNHPDSEIFDDSYKVFNDVDEIIDDFLAARLEPRLIHSSHP